MNLLVVWAVWNYFEKWEEVFKKNNVPRNIKATSGDVETFVAMMKNTVS
jgi:hypothetical protein